MHSDTVMHIIIWGHDDYVCELIVGPGKSIHLVKNRVYPALTYFKSNHMGPFYL